ncbi:MAG TPA: LysR family transcriptional regulator [Pyrinomonadaceae bacterium]
MKNEESSGKPEKELSRRQEAALVALLETGSVKDAAAACNLSQPTLFRYLQEPLFITRYREARGKLVETAIAKVQSAAESAVNTLLEIAQDREAAPTARIAAARAILSQAVRGLDWAENGARSAESEHIHLCAGCHEKYSCFGNTCADLQFGRCGKCPKLPHERDVTP